jgi:electron transfer flavoprotein alpha subunit
LPVGAEEVLTLAREHARARGGELAWLVLGPAPERAADAASQFGVQALARIDDPKLASFRPDAFVEALAQYCTQASPKVLLMPQTFESRSIAPRLAGRLGACVVANAVAVETADGGALHVTATAYGGDTHVVYELAGASLQILTVTTTALVAQPADAPSSPQERSLTVDLSSVEERVRVVQAAKSEGPKLEDANIIVSGGRGLGAVENYALVRQLAEALGGMAGVSRPLVDEGWVDSSHQVGLTGKITRPTLYIAAGISGASQHMAGCSAAKAIVAINSDPDAAIFRYARFGIVGNCLEILPELIRAAKG